jgi:hypothetical protein
VLNRLRQLLQQDGPNQYPRYDHFPSAHGDDGDLR